MRDVLVLVAEDNEDHMYLTTRALRRVPDVNVQVDGVRDGAEALDYLYRRGEYEGGPLPDVILLDLSIPRRNGLEVLRTVKGDRTLAYIPVVILTSSDRPEDIRAAYTLGANSYVSKSCDMAKLAEYWATTVTLPDG